MDKNNKVNSIRDWEREEKQLICVLAVVQPISVTKRWVFRDAFMILFSQLLTRDPIRSFDMLSIISVLSRVAGPCLTQ
jgi:hypothetical protein